MSLKKTGVGQVRVEYYKLAKVLAKYSQLLEGNWSENVALKRNTNQKHVKVAIYGYRNRSTVSLAVLHT